MRRGKAGHVSCQPPTESIVPAAASLGTSESVKHAKRRPSAVAQNHNALERCGTESKASNATPVARISEEACTPCGACQAVCPTEAISLGESSVEVNAEACCGCGACVDVCPSGAITLVLGDQVRSINR